VGVRLRDHSRTTAERLPDAAAIAATF